MVLKTKIKVSQSKKAWTQYVTIPSAVVQDSQYPFIGSDELYLKIEPTTGIMILSKEDKQINVTSDGDLVIGVSKIVKAELLANKIRDE